jgi:hypothetical protein
MNKIRCFVIDVYHTATVILVGFAAWKLVHHWRAGCAEKTGDAIDASIKTAADKLGKTAIALEEWADNGLGEKLGKRVDEVLIDARGTLEKATNLFQHTSSHSK